MPRRCLDGKFWKAQGYDIDEDMYQRCRKRVLDQGNDTIREIEDYLNNFDVRLK